MHAREVALRATNIKAVIHEEHAGIEVAQIKVALLRIGWIKRQGHAGTDKLQPFDEKLPLHQLAVVDVQIQPVHRHQHLLVIWAGVKTHFPRSEPIRESQAEALEVDMHATLLKLCDDEPSPAPRKTISERIQRTTDDRDNEHHNEEAAEQIEHEAILGMD